MMTARPSATNSDDDDPAGTGWRAPTQLSINAPIVELMHANIADTAWPRAARNAILDMAAVQFSSNSNSSSNKNNGSDLNLSTSSLLHVATSAANATTRPPALPSAPSTLSTTEHIPSFMYEETEVDAINRSLLLTTAVTATATSGTGTGTSASLLTATTGAHNGSGIIGGDNEDWSRFYDLMLSWQGICLIAVFSTFIVVTIIGNTLVILAVITTRRLKTVTNCFVMSLAVADLLVGIFVMPPAVAVHLIGSWQLGWVLCDIWISLDVLLCTASILSLCAISVDRYLAVTQPLNYSRKRRSKRLALIMILVVWLLALAITCPPMLGWYEPGRRDLSECRYNQNEGYVIFSAMGSFFIPMAVMIYVYARISCVIASRHDNMTDISVHNKKFKRYTSADVDNDIEHDYSEQELSSGHRKQAAARTLSNQTIAKELHEVMLSEGENGGGSYTGGGGAGGSGGGGSSCGIGAGVGAGAAADGASHCHSLLALSTTNAKNSCYELTRPTSFRRTPTSSSTMTIMTSGCGAASGSTGAGGDVARADQHWTMRTHSMRHHHFNVPGTATAAGGSSTAASPHLQPDANAGGRQPRVHHHHHHAKSFSNRITSLKKENKTTQTLSIVVGGFIACWLPFFVYYLITPFLEEHQVSRTLAKGLTWLGWFNSAINPFIYAFYSVDFRAAFWRLTCKRFFSGSMKPQFPTNTMSIRR